MLPIHLDFFCFAKRPWRLKGKVSVCEGVPVWPVWPVWPAGGGLRPVWQNHAASFICSLNSRWKQQRASTVSSTETNRSGVKGRSCNTETIDGTNILLSCRGSSWGQRSQPRCWLIMEMLGQRTQNAARTCVSIWVLGGCSWSLLPGYSSVAAGGGEELQLPADDWRELDPKSWWPSCRVAVGRVCVCRPAWAKPLLSVISCSVGSESTPHLRSPSRSPHRNRRGDPAKPNTVFLVIGPSVTNVSR